MRGRLAALVFLSLLVGGCAEAQLQPQPQSAAAAEEPSPLPVVTPSPASTAALLPAGCTRRAEACVSTRHRLAWLQRGGRVVRGPVRISLGTRRHPTPRGVFHVVWKDAEHTSSIYGLDMPWSVFFAHGGIAFHEGPVDESSHGCVHLPAPAAEAFFAALRRGDRVEVF